MTDWLELCRQVVSRQREIFDEVVGIDARTEYDGVGSGGDHTLVIDRRCEDIVFEEIERGAADLALTAISEERGEVELGPAGEDRSRIVIDPIDGSLNARRTIPSHSLSIAVASGPAMADVEFGFVHDFGASEEFSARRGEGAWLNGRPLAVPTERLFLEVVGIEAAQPELALPALEALSGQVYRMRAVGSLAITMSYVAAGRFDGMLGLRPARSVDVAASQLIVREAGGQVEFGEDGLEGASLSLEARYPVIAATFDDGLPALRTAQAAARAVSA